MSTPTSKVLLAAALMALAACSDGFGVTRSAPERIQLPDGMVIAGANGWCIDERTSRARGEAAVVVLGSCAAIAGNGLLPQPDVPGVVTVSVEAEAGSVPTSEQLEGFFTTEAGRAALARDGRAESVKLLETRREDGLLFLHAADRSVAPGMAADVWRALFGLRGRVVSVSLYGSAEARIAPEDGLAALAAQVDELRAANGG